MSAFRAEHIERSHHFVVERPAGRAFELFTPEGERAWADGWDPTYLHPADGTPQRGMVFTTGHGGEHTLWTMTRYEPQAGLVEYQRITPGSRMGSVLVQCTSLGASRTRVTVAYALTALTEDGNRVLRGMDDAKFQAFIEDWERAIAGIKPAA
ncbi:MAG TPA: hypothetical protein VEC19_12925 [Usitatibacter sp.]|nr:hypothetical protein [Usitatibacter sp.]